MKRKKAPHRCGDIGARWIIASPCCNCSRVWLQYFFKPRCSFLDKPRTPSPPANLDSGRKPPHTWPGGWAENRAFTPHSPQLTAGLAAAARGNLGMKRSETPMTHRYTEPAARSRRPLFPQTSLIRQTVRPDSSRDGQISLLLVVTHRWLPRPPDPQIRQMAMTIFFFSFFQSHTKKTVVVNWHGIIRETHD